jgi:hypothetical protein
MKAQHQDISEDDNVIVQIKHDRSEARVIAQLDGIRRCRWENWDGPEINYRTSWAEGYYLASGAITSHQANCI